MIQLSGQTSKLVSFVRNLVVNAEIAVATSDSDVGFIETAHTGHAWPRRQFFFEFVHLFALAFGHDFHSSIRQVSHRADDLVTRRNAEREVAETNALHFAVNDEMSGYHQPHSSGEARVRSSAREPRLVMERR